MVGFQIEERFQFGVKNHFLHMQKLKKCNASSCISGLVLVKTLLHEPISEGEEKTAKQALAHFFFILYIFLYLLFFILPFSDDRLFIVSSSWWVSITTV